MPGASLGVGAGEAVAAGLADGVAAAGVFVVGGDVADGFVQPHGVVAAVDAFGLAAQVAGVLECFEAGVLGLDVPEEGLDRGLVGGVEGLRNCWAMEQIAMNLAVVFPRNLGVLRLSSPRRCGG